MRIDHVFAGQQRSFGHPASTQYRLGKVHEPQGLEKNLTPSYQIWYACLASRVESCAPANLPARQGGASKERCGQSATKG